MSGAAEYIAAFLSHLAAARRYSPHTIAAYRRDLQKLRAGGASLREISPRLIRRKIAADKKAHPSSLARRLAAWRSFFDYLIERGVVADNPARLVAPPKKPALLPKALTPDEAAAYVCADGDDALAKRDRAMAELFYSSAMRLSELARLDADDLDLAGGAARIRRGKGGRGRIAPVGKKARAALRGWLRERRVWLAGGAQKALFISRRRTRLGARAIQKRIARRGGGIGRAVSPHMLRHSAASHFLQSSGDLRATQELLGHRNIAATQIYTHLDFQHLAKTYDRAHPRAQAGGVKRGGRGR